MYEVQISLNVVSLYKDEGSQEVKAFLFCEFKLTNNWQINLCKSRLHQCVNPVSSINV